MYERHCILIWAHNARIPAARHMRLTRLTGPKAFRSKQKCARPTSRACSQSSLIARSSRLRTRGYAQATTAPSLCISILQASIWKHLYEANAVCRLACRAMSAAKPTGDSDAAALLYPPAPTCARPSSLRARDSYRRSTGSKVACGRAVASERQVSLSFWPRPGSSGRLQLSRR